MLTEINVTPLVDVMLVLLIIFMVTAPMLQTGVDVDLPQAKAQTIPDDEGKLILTVTKDKRVFLGKMQIPFDDVEKILKGNAKLNADHELYLHADKALLYGRGQDHGRGQTGRRRQAGDGHRPAGVTACPPRPNAAPRAGTSPACWSRSCFTARSWAR
jgi:biopolymer transport protein ExbD